MQLTIDVLTSKFADAGIITLAVMPNALINPNHAESSLAPLLDDVPDEDVADALGVPLVDLHCENRAAPSLADAVAAIMDRLASGQPGHGYLVRFLRPNSGGGYATRLLYGASLEDVAQRMLRA